MLFGPSGSGKSLTLAAIAGLLRPDAGRIAIGGETLFDAARGVDLPPERRRVGYVPQGYALFPHLTVADNITYGLRGLPGPEVRRRLDEVLALLGLGGQADRRPGQVSGGQQQRVALARALVVRPRLLLLDEPFAALDAEIRRLLRAELVELRRRLGIAVVFVTHDLGEAHAVGEQVALYDRGGVLQVGPIGEVFARPVSQRAAELTGTRNVLPGRVAAATADGLRVRVGGYEIETPPYPFPPGEAVLVCLRPEHALLVRPGTEPHVAPRSNLVRGRIVREVASGAFYTLVLRLEGAELELEVDVPAHPYEVMGVAERPDWEVSLKRSAIHLIRAC
ncbi:MAG TPA: ABC transporter ATP-binding protein [Chloroflexota bacterium]|nr:ABC transporter ATP-binding protein [Chloroflexota bacterium]